MENTTQLPDDQPRSKRGAIRYQTNPFVTQASNGSKIGTKRLSNKTGDRMMIVSEQGEILAPAGFHEVVEVDKTQFVKLYINGVKAFKELTGAGTKVFEILYMAVQQQPGQDKITMHYAGIDQLITPISRATFSRGMAELLKKGFIAESMVPSQYFLNIDYLFNGNRLAFIKEVRLAGAKPDKATQLEAAGQLRLTQ